MAAEDTCRAGVGRPEVSWDDLLWRDSPTVQEEATGSKDLSMPHAE